MTRAIGESMRAVGVHQGLSPVLDVVRDYRWGRVEETHRRGPVPGRHDRHARTSAGWSRPASSRRSSTSPATRHRRRPATTRRSSIGPRDVRDVILPPFEMAIREGGARSVMNSYSDIDGLPVGRRRGAADRRAARRVGVRGRRGLRLLGDRVRCRSCTGWPARPARRARWRSRPASTSSCPHTRCYGEALAELVRAGAVPEALVDRAARRGAAPERRAGSAGRRTGRRSRRRWPRRARPRPARQPGAAREIAEASVVLLDNDGSCRWRRVALDRAGRPVRRRPARLPRLLLLPQPRRHRRPSGSRARGSRCRRCSTRCGPSWPTPRHVHAPGCPIQERDRSGFAGGGGCRAVGRRVRRGGRGPAGPVRAWHLGRGLRRRGPVAARRPGRAAGRTARDRHAGRARGRVGAAVRARPLRGPAAAVVQAFIPGEEGGAALAGVLSGRVAPSGQAAGAGAAQRRRAAEHVPASRARRQQRRGQQHRSYAAVPLRPRPFVHGLRVRRTSRSAPTRSRRTARWRCPASCTTGRPRGRRGRPALHRRSGGAGDPAGDRARRLRPRRRSSRASGRA